MKRTLIQRDQRQQLEDLLVSHVQDVYRAWGRHGAEPILPTTYLLDFALQHGRCPEDLRYSSRKTQRAIVRSVLQSAVSSGKLGTSIAPGRNDREVRCFEPA